MVSAGKAIVRSDRATIRMLRRRPIVMGLCAAMTPAIDSIPGTVIPGETTLVLSWDRSSAVVTKISPSNVVRQTSFMLSGHPPNQDAAIKVAASFFALTIVFRTG